MLHQPFNSKDDLKKSVWEEHPFWDSGGFVMFELHDHSVYQSIHSAKCLLFYSSFSSNHSGETYVAIVARNWINCVPQAAVTAFAFPLYLSLFYDTSLCIYCIGVVDFQYFHRSRMSILRQLHFEFLSLINFKLFIY